MGRHRLEYVTYKVIKVAAKKYLQLRYVDPWTGRWRQMSTGKKRRREALVVAGRMIEKVASEPDMDATEDSKQIY